MLNEKKLFTKMLEEIKSGGGGGGGDPNQNAFSYVKVGNSTIAADTVTDTLELAAGTNVTLTADTTNDKVTISASGGGGGGATQNIWFATCSTTQDTSAKVATTTSGDFVLTTGNMVRIEMVNNNLANTATLNVDGTGAVSLRPLSGYDWARGFWRAGEVVDVVYDGTYFVMSNKSTATSDYNGITTLSDSVSSNVSTRAATSAAVKTAYDLAASKSVVAVSQTQTSGTELATITVDSVATKIYAPTIATPITLADVYPVGSIYESVSATAPTMSGITWTPIGTTETKSGAIVTNGGDAIVTDGGDGIRVATVTYKYQRTA